MNVIVFYQSDATTYGHLRMAHSLASYLAEQAHHVVMICLGTSLPDFPVHPKITHIEVQAIVQIKAIVKEHQPHHFITEFMPFGRAHLRSEMRDFLSWLKSYGPQIKITSTMREFVGRDPDQAEPGKLLKHQRRINFDLTHFYDLLLVFAPERLKNQFDVELDSEFLNKKSKWCGYLTPLEITSFNEKRELVRELVIGFGGAANPMPLMKAIKKIEKTLAINPHFYLSHKAQSLINSEELDGFKVSHFTQDFPRRLQAYEVAILYSGYGNTSERLRAALPTLLISTEAHLEQQLRLKSVAGIDHIKTIKHEEISPEILQEHLSALLQIDPLKIVPNEEEFFGAHNALKYLMAL